jgi:crotonobetainyl-CoA:carnitine CoA-transferase CaiB-like acyl-CoA transferase
MNKPGSGRGPLSGLLVVEMGQLIAGPFCGQLLGDMGAEVVKIETPGAGDPMREWGRGAKPLWWEVIARNKKSVTINLRTEAGQALSRRLIAKSDIVIENFRPGTLEKWGMGPNVLHADNPRLIITRMSGYGQTGPYAQRAGYGLIGEAMGGWRHIVGEPDRPPSRMGVSIGDSLCATYGCLGALAALRHRDMTGEGQVIDASLYESVLQVMESLVVDYSVAGYVRERTGAILPGIAPSNVYRCKDGDYLIGANQDSVFVRLCMAMGEPELAAADAYSSHESRGKNQAKLDEHITRWTSVRSVEEVEEAMIAHGIPAGRVYRAPDMISDPQFRARQSIVDLEHPVYGSIKMQNAFPFFSRTPGGVRRLAPATPGQDNQQVFGEILGLGECELKQLERDGTI